MRAGEGFSRRKRKKMPLAPTLCRRDGPQERRSACGPYMSAASSSPWLFSRYIGCGNSENGRIKWRLSGWRRPSNGGRMGTGTTRSRCKRRDETLISPSFVRRYWLKSVMAPPRPVTHSQDQNGLASNSSPIGSSMRRAIPASITSVGDENRPALTCSSMNS